MKKYFKLLILFIFMMLVVITPFSSSLAKEQSSISINLTNIIAPTIGGTPSYNYDLDYELIQPESVIDSFIFDSWYEIDAKYEDALAEMQNINTINDYYKYFEDFVSKTNFNPEYGFNPTEHEFDAFSADKTYMAVFHGYFYDIDLNSMDRGSSGISNHDDSLPTITATINGSFANVKSLIYQPVISFSGGNPRSRNSILNPNYEYTLYNFTVFALYNLKLPTQDIKATVNWINAEDENIPESFTLRLRNGNSVIKEQVLSKSNAIDSDTWEFNFGEYPIQDNEGNPIKYTLEYAESKDGDLKFFTTAQDDFVINNTFIPPEISSKVKMTSMVDREINNVKYKIDFKVSIKKYFGNANVTLTATLPFSVDVSKSNLDGGTYNEITRSIVWEDEIKEIDKIYNYSATKNIDLYATAVLPYSIETVTVGQVLLEDVAGFSETVDATDVVDNVGNPKTGDINIVKYLSIALVGIGTILIVIQIKRKYSTKKNKVLF